MFSNDRVRLRTSWSTLAGISEYSRNRANAWTLHEVQIVVCLVERRLLEFPTSALWVPRKHDSACTEFSFGIRNQRVDRDETVCVYGNTAATWIRAAQYQLVYVNEIMSNVQIQD